MEILPATHQWQQKAALKLLSRRLDPLAQEESIKQTLASAEAGLHNFDHMLVVQNEAHEVLAATWLVISDDLTGHVFPPELRDEDSPQSDAIWMMLTQALIDRITLSKSWIGQILLHPDEVTQKKRLDASPFQWISDLTFLSLALTPESFQSDSSIPLETIPYQPDVNDDLFIDVMRRSYLASLDFPEVNRYRTAGQAFDSHLSQSQLNPEFWRLCQVQGEPAGMLLLSPASVEDWEVTYLGIAPEFRGQGLGKQFFQQGLKRVWDAGGKRVTLGLDRRNHYAAELYASTGFQQQSACHFYAWFPTT